MVKKECSRQPGMSGRKPFCCLVERKLFAKTYVVRRLESSEKKILPSLLARAIGQNSEGSLIRLSDFGIKMMIACCQERGISVKDQARQIMVYNIQESVGHLFHTR